MLVLVVSGCINWVTTLWLSVTLSLCVQSCTGSLAVSHHCVWHIPSSLLARLHSVWGQYRFTLWRPSSSVTLHGGPAGDFTCAGQAMTWCRLQSNYSSTVTLHGGPVVLRFLLGRLGGVDLIKWVSNVRPPVRPPTKSLFDFNEIGYVGIGRRVMHDGMQYDPVQG